MQGTVNIWVESQRTGTDIERKVNKVLGNARNHIQTHQDIFHVIMHVGLSVTELQYSAENGRR